MNGKKHIFLLLFLMSFFLCSGQVDYQGKPAYLTSKDSVVRVDWIIKSSGKCTVSFDHHITFTNVLNDDLTLTQVYGKLYCNDNLIKEYIFTTGDGIENWIYDSDIKVKSNDNLYFLFYLKDTGVNEKYVFSIYKKKYREVKVVKDESFSVAKQLDNINIYKRDDTIKEKNKPNKFMLGVVGVTGFLLGLD